MKEVKLTEATALRAYAHPLRLRLIGLLRGEGPMTATQAAARLGESVPNCSFHLRQLAKYGLAERAPGADGRERPWRATARYTSWDDSSDDPAVQQASDQLNAAILEEYTRRAREYLGRRGDEPTEWRRAAGFGDVLTFVTAGELAELTAEIDAVMARFDERLEDPARRPAGARAVQIIRMAVPRD
ncbi:winged helix-turn-helix domain-containing protein [Paractinoplanes globisporus]|uniref:Helix-turn-helix domain-containing protein n=1 Tax=Paractinoplanes globisporus TaxID=113565 RepID=A0ABW6WQX1_9ACTN|nr:winged helix-turn-helix domain-containing protein [Actinoplanes globisporus]